MTTRTVCIETMENIQPCVHIMNGFHGRFDLVAGASAVNAKSIMGVFSLDISQPIALYIYNDETAETVTKAISSFEI